MTDRIRATRASLLVDPVLSALLAEADDETRAMFHRLMSYKARQRACPHRDSWLRVGAEHWSCQSCGLIARDNEYKGLMRWDEPAPPPAEALGTELAAWRVP
jgi:hypothetical protein